jgi:hypothetical protein
VPLNELDGESGKKEREDGQERKRLTPRNRQSLLKLVEPEHGSVSGDVSDRKEEPLLPLRHIRGRFYNMWIEH